MHAARCRLILVMLLPLLFLSLYVATTPRAIAIVTPRTVPQEVNGHLESERVREYGPSEEALFIENVGQFPEQFLYSVIGGDQTVWITADGLWFTYLETGRADGLSSEPRRGVHIKLSFPGALPNPTVYGLHRGQAQVSYFRGNDASRWVQSAPTWVGVRYESLYPGIDLEIAPVGGHLRPIFYIQDAADLERVSMLVDGAEPLRMTGNGELVLDTALGELGLPLFAVRYEDGTPLSKASAIPSIDGMTVLAPIVQDTGREENGAWDYEVIDYPPSLLQSTYLGGRGYDYGLANAVGADDSLYIIGGATSTDFPVTPGAFDPAQNGGYDAFVAKFTATGELTYATFLGGYKSDGGWDIGVDAKGNVYALGFTGSADFPVTGDAYQATLGGANDMFLSKLGPMGATLLYSTYFGGTGQDCYFSSSGLIYGLCALTVDNDEAVYVAGSTDSSNFPTTVQAYDRTNNGSMDAYVAKFRKKNSALTLDYSTLLGGSGWDAAYGIAVYGGDAFITGLTESSGFPTTASAYDRTFNGHADGFVTRVNALGADLSYSTYLGGSQNDHAFAIAVDLQGQAYVAGLTNSSNFPIMPGAFDATSNGGTDSFVARIGRGGNRLLGSTFVGGASDDRGMTIWAGSGEIILGGVTRSNDFPTSSRGFDASLNGSADGFVMSLDYMLRSRGYSTYLGGTGGECHSHILNRAMVNCDLAGSSSVTTTVYFAGYTDSGNYPTTADAYDTTLNGAVDAFISKVDIRNVPDVVTALRQDVPPWNEDVYGAYPDGDEDPNHTVGSLGCFMTSAAMIIDFFGRERQPSTMPSPRDFNSWLRANEGYNRSSLVIHNKIIEYAMLNGVPLSISTHRASRDDTALNDILDKGELAILGVNGNGHYVVATSRVTNNGQTIYQINDPLSGSTTLTAEYGGNYNSILAFSGAAADKSLLTLSAHSPVEFVVTDPLGRRTGYDPDTGTTWNEIPGATYFEDTLAPGGGAGNDPLALRAHTFLLLRPINGQYQVEVIGTGEGSYELLAAGSSADGHVSQAIEAGNATVGSRDVLEVTYHSQLGLVPGTLYLPSVFR